MVTSPHSVERTLDPHWLLACKRLSTPAFVLDESLRVLHGNGPALELLGEEIASRNARSIPEMVARGLDLARDTGADHCDVTWVGPKRNAKLRLTLHRKPNSRALLVAAFDIDSAGIPGDRGAVAGNVFAFEGLERGKPQIHAFVDSLPGPSMLIDRDLRYRWVNERYERWVGRRSEELVGRKLDEVFDEVQVCERRPYWVCALSGLPAMGERTVTLPNGERRALRVHYVPVRDDMGQVAGFYTVGSDIQDLRESERRTSFLTSHDTLTGLPNRSLVREMLAQAVARGRRSGHMLALLFIDLDHFKDINETLGHRVGDALIRLVPRRLLDALRGTDYLGRISGDEFMVILENLAEANAAEIAARKLVDAMRQPFDVDGHRIYLTASVGICLWPEQGDDAEELLKRGDAAMHRAKQAGRNTHCLFTPDMLHASARRQRLNTALHQALDNEELEVHYQPIVNLRSRAIVGAEALLRWRHPESGWIPPGEFVALAEETGFIRDIGDWVFDKACRQLSEWQVRHPDLCVSVNVSLQQLRHDDLLGHVRRRIEDHGCNPKRLTLELTETSLLYDPDRAGRTLAELRAFGLRVAVDDFGTGYSSLSHLRRFAVDAVKVDRSFVTSMLQSDTDRAIVSAVVALAGALRLEAVAEGVETDAQRVDLLELGCATGQGFLFAQAVPAPEFEVLLGGAAAGAQRPDTTVPP